VKSSKKRALVSNTLSDKLLALLKMARRQSAKAENWGFTELRKPQRLVLMSPLAFYWLVFFDLFQKPNSGFRPERPTVLQPSAITAVFFCSLGVCCAVHSNFIPTLHQGQRKIGSVMAAPLAGSPALQGDPSLLICNRCGTNGMFFCASNIMCTHVHAKCKATCVQIRNATKAVSSSFPFIFTLCLPLFCHGNTLYDTV
jgi:hypothetical protein